MYLFLAVYLAVKLDHGVDPKGNPLGQDFLAFWGASQLALAGKPESAYDGQDILAAERAAAPGLQVASPWQYPPTFYLAILPLGLLPYFPALILFLSASFAGYAVAIRRILPRPEALLPLLAFPGGFINAGGGQNGFLTAALMSWALLLLDRSPVVAGALFGLLAIKPHLAVLLPVALLCGRRWRAFAAAAFSAVAFLALSVVVMGRGVLDAFLAKLPVVAGWLAGGELPLQKMPTFFALARLAGIPVTAAFIVHGLFALLAVLGTAWAWSSCRRAPMRAATLVCATLLVSPYLYDYDLVWLAPAVAWFVGDALRSGWLPGEREILLAAWLLPGLVLVACRLTHLQLAPLVVLALFLAILRRCARNDEAPAEGQPA